MTLSTAALARDFEIRIAWLGRDVGEPLERATAAEIGISLPDGRNLTRIEDTLAQTVRGTARLSAHRLAGWFTANWWRLRWEPFADTLGWRMSHHMAAAGDGYVWPDIVFASDGRHVRVSARATEGAPFEPIAYLVGAEAVIEAAAFERAVDRFVDTTVARLCATGLDAADLVAAWRELREERLDPEAATYRRLEAASGFDPDEAPTALIDDRLALAAEWGSAAAEDIAAAARSEPSRDLRGWLDDARRNAAPVAVPDAAALRAEVSPPGSEAPWTMGYRLADAMRRSYGLGVRPVGDDALHKLFDLDGLATRVPTGPEPLAAAFLGEPSSDGLDVRLTARHPAARRFQLMRLIGGSLAASEGRAVPATRAATARQKLQRAFAAEFLCPIDGLREILPMAGPDDDDVEAAAIHFGVSTDVVRHDLANHGAHPVDGP